MGRAALVLVATIAVTATFVPAAQAAPVPPDTVIQRGPCSGDEPAFDASYTDIDCASAPFAPIAYNAPGFQFAADDGSTTFTCRLDTIDPWFPCGSGLTPVQHTRLFGVPEGTHTLEVRAINGVGTDATPDDVTFVVDTVHPTESATFLTWPGVEGTSATANFTFAPPATPAEPVNLLCNLEAPPVGVTLPKTQDTLPQPAKPPEPLLLGEGDWFLCESPLQLTGLTDGLHRLSLVVADQAGNASTTMVIRQWRVDATAPETTIDVAPSSLSAFADATFEFSADELATFECSLDGVAFTACTNPKAYLGLADGAHNFRVRATDEVGNVDATPAEWDWTVDAVAPDTFITSGPDLSGTDFSFSFNSDDGSATFECRLDAGAWTNCTSPKTYSGLIDGSMHTFDVRAVDQFGRVDATPASATWTVDFTPPNTFINSGPNPVENVDTATFTFSSDDPAATFQCSLDGAAFAACTSPRALSSLAEGSHTFRVRAVDVNLNVDPSPASQTWTVFTVATLTVNKAGAGSGDVTSAPPGISCGSACASDSANFAPATVVTLSAVADPGDVFIGWSGSGCAGTGDCVVTMDQNRTVTATFDPIPPDSYQPDLMVRRSGAGAYRGDNIYNSDSTDQSVRLSINPGGTRRFDILVQNDSTAPDKIKVKGCSGNPRYSVRYTTGGDNVTSDVKAGREKTPMLAPGDAVVYRLSITADEGVRSTLYCAVKGTSVTDPSMVDVVQGRVDPD